MADRPDPIARLYLLLEASRIAHEAIFDLHSQLVAIGSRAPSLRLLHESADIAIREIPGIASEARRLAARWSEESVLRPSDAEATLELQANELERVEPPLRELLSRQVSIARELRSLFERDRG